VPRIHLIENEYLLAMRKAELAWVRPCEKELRTGKLRWDLRKIFAEAQVVKSRAAAAAGKPGAKQAQKGETSYE